ncbi:chitin synthase [Parastagonospora nodorum]|uniref:chitin synthase n=1 Tax=Phaeosphaeria nodorum (strain SN15 / ATCC MYA-4574 / FGSC 10173) TaxID=321614 RepID=A0A7U2I9T1_PHANO|nr:chitin synthase [Parastagonospora nodorum]QRD05890.1 chitin synthase [Parastagonospora nodorum SN15]KAH3956853.1 chitin synthase [Parastagonospora nodorum]KAH3971657.1 chitin synthase [Parastagonospora nodorum]KAH3994372.1 chitin synthase [Parastagonospora nodorum]
MSFVNNSRMSVYSTASAQGPHPGQSPSQVSTTSLLNYLNSAYKQSQAYSLEASTSLVVNTWVNSKSVINDRIGGTVDLELGRKAWEHARRRAEDGCIVLASLHESTPSLFAPFVSSLPLSLPGNFYTALEVLKAFTHCVTPQNPFAARYSALAAVFTINLTGSLVGAEIKLSTSGLDVQQGLLQVPAHSGFRAFDVFYYLNSSSASKQEREFLDIQPLDRYTLLNRSGTYNPPNFLPDADDAAAAEDFRTNLKAIGIKGQQLRDLISCLTGLLKLGNTLDYFMDEEALQSTCQEVAELLDVSPEVLQEKLSSNERQLVIGGIYEAIVDFVIAHANTAIKADIRAAKAGHGNESDGSQPGMMTPDDSEDEAGDIVNITVVDVPSRALGKALALRTVFDDSEGINAEMKEDGVQFAPAGGSVLEGMREAIQNCEAELGISGPGLREKEQDLERREAVLEKVMYEVADEGNFVRQVLAPVQGEGVVLGKHGRFDLPITAASSRVWFQLAVHPTDSMPTSTAQDLQSTWQAGVVSRQLREWRLPEWANRRNRSLDFTADFDHAEFYQRYHPLGCMEGRDGIQSWVLQRGWSNGEVVVGTERVWVREGTWWEAESQLDQKTQDFNGSPSMLGGMIGAGGMESAYGAPYAPSASSFFPPLPEQQAIQNPFQSSASLAPRSMADAKSIAPTIPVQSAGDYGLGRKGDENKGVTYYDAESGGNAMVTESPLTASRRMWIAFVWVVTFWMPSPLLKLVGRMKRPDVRMAWREKFVLFLMIILLNAAIVFYIVAFGKLLCPNKDKVWSRGEVSSHQGENDYFVSHRGVVYDLTSFWKKQHSDSNTESTRDRMIEMAGADMDPYIMPPLYLACPNLIDGNNQANKQMFLTSNATLTNTFATHKSGSQTNLADSKALQNENWYPDVFLPAMREFRKGELVWKEKDIKKEGEDLNHMWFTLKDRVYDLTDYFKTLDMMNDLPQYKFLDTKLTDLVKSKAGTDLSEDYSNLLSADAQAKNLQCLDNQFYVGKTDFRDTARCKVNDYILLAVAILLVSVIVVKFLAALQLGSRKRPANQDKFVICQVPAYTEGEDQLRKGLDSLTALAYDNKRKLICVVCDGMIVGGGNDRPTPKIVLDILGVDPKVDPPALPFWSVGEGSEQLNYGKVYSGLYEFEGNVVPYLVVVKMGKESEQQKSKPGNRGKRDSQILLMSFLNRVHHRSAMNPLELEMFHQINNIIGVDPELYEYLLMVDADTMVRPDALNRLVASCANDSKIAGICGETSLDNEDRSWWTMIQVYEYYISHHLSKAFESLFGSVTCLPGCFCMYRLRTADKGKPLIIADKVIKDYADCAIDTLHKKNLLSLGEDRYLTTLMTKHFPTMSYKFIPDAYALTAAPETWSILLSQRRRWINSTIHNLAELVFLKDLCGFCCFSMRFVVFIDLFGTLVLPSICAYLVYLIYSVASGKGQFPLLSIIMLAAVYGLQALIFIIKRQWQHVGWMIIYLMAFPIYSLALPMYSFWKQDDFSWGNTRVVIGEQGTKKVLTTDDEGFDPKAIPMMRWDDYAERNELPGRRGMPGQASEKGGLNPYEDEAYELNDMQSVYSSVKPASTIMSNMQHISHMPPQSPGPYQGMQTRQSTYSNFSRYQDNPNAGRQMSMGNMSEQFARQPSPYNNRPNHGGFQSSDNLMASTPPIRGRSPLGFDQSRPGSTVNFQNMMNGPNDATIVEVVQQCLREADLDRITKKQLVALAEQRLQAQLTGERKIFLSHTIDEQLANMG